MGFEQRANEQEPRVHTMEEIQSKMEQLIGKEGLDVVRTREDARGVYLHEVVMGNANGGTLYAYRRKGNFPETKSNTTVIDTAIFEGALEDNRFVGGDTLAKFNEESGQWKDF